jgi:sigma-B regulation protein RsbU (phosphoserine phosphatase)
MHAHSDLTNLVDGVERLILAASPRHLYASLFYSEYDPVTRVLSYVNAGHNAPMVLRWKNNECKIFTLESTGPPLGLLEGSQLTSQALQLETDDVLVMYTDGMTEAESPGRRIVGTGAAQNRAARLPSLLACSNTHPHRRWGLIFY